MSPRTLFVHLAKTGGMSVRRLLCDQPAVPAFDCIHHGYVLQFRGGSMQSRRQWTAGDLEHYDVAFLIVRDPLQRLISCYRYFMAGGLNQRHPGAFPADAEFQAYLIAEAPTLTLCCSKLDQIARRIDHFQPMTYWLDRLPNPLASLVMVGRQEQLATDLARILPFCGKSIDTAAIPHRNRSAESVCYSSLDASSLANVFAFYDSDYQRFGYARSCGQAG